MSPLRLGDLVDLEARILDEQGEPLEVRRSRYRQLGRRLAERGPLPDDPGGLLRTLLQLDPRPGSLGRRFASALHLVQAGLAILGLLVGGSLTLGLIQNTGKDPVNILTVLTVLVGSQLLLLALLLIALFPAGDRRASGPVHHLLLGLLHRLLRKAGAADQVHALQERLDTHRGLLRWTLIRATQIFGIAFNVAVISCSFFRFAVTDIHFCWSTTLPISAETVHAVAKAFATPWSWISPSRMEPKLSMVLATEYSHLKGEFVRPPSGEAALWLADMFAWWSFFTWSVLTYGLVPRLIVGSIAALRMRHILADTPRTNVELARLCDWMRTPEVTTRPEGPDPARHDVPPASPAAEPPLPPTGSTCELDDGAPAGADQRIRERFGWTVAPGSGGPLVAVVSAWEEPTRGALRRIAELRDRAADRLLVVALLDPSPAGGDVDAARRARIRERWKRDLPRALEGLRVRVEPL
jgi:hypothetical protein